MSLRTKKLLKAFPDLARQVPWWVSLAITLVLYAMLHGVSTSSIGEIKHAGFTRLVAKSIKALAFFAQYLMPSLVLAGAGISFFKPRKPDPAGEWAPSDALANISWSEFELLTAEAFRRLDYRVERVDRPDGVDLVLTKYGLHYLVQCKHWHAWNAGEQQARELHDLITAQGAAGGFLVNSGRFTPEADRYARSRKIRLIDGDALLKIARACPMTEPVEENSLACTQIA